MATWAYQNTETSLSYLLHCNLAPSVSQAVQISNLISEWEAELSSLDADIDGAKTSAEKLPLIRQQTNMREKLTAFRAVFSPLRRLPPELLMEIFLFCRRSRLLLCKVCSVWRNMAIGIPGLWNDIYIDFTVRDFDSRVAEAKTWLDRACSAPLSITMNLRERIKVLPNPIPDILFPHLNFLRHLHLNFPPEYLKPLFEMPAGSVDQLEELSLSIQIPKLPRHPRRAMPLTVFRHAPCLKKFTCRSLQNYLNPAMLNIPCSRLTYVHINIQDLPLSAYNRMLQQCTNLVECKLCCWGWDAGDAAPLQMTMLSKLHTLDITCPGGGSLSPFFRRLTLPALKTLSLTFSGSQCDWSQTTFMALKSRSSFDLKRLSLAHVRVCPEDLVAFLHDMPSINRLDFNDSTPFDMFMLHALTYSETNVNFVAPHLEGLVAYHTEVGSSDAFADMIQSRWWRDSAGGPQQYPISRLKFVYRTNDGGSCFSSKALRRLGSFQDEGLEIDVD